MRGSFKMWFVQKGSPLGSTIETAEISDGQVTHAKLGSNVLKWKLLETLTYDGSGATGTSGTLDAHDEYMILINLTPAAGANISLVFNGDTANNYGYLNTDDATDEQSTSKANIILGYAYQTNPMIASIRCNGKTPAQASGRICCHIDATSVLGGSCDFTHWAQWTGGNETQITTITVASAENLSGSVQIYGRDL
jgi:hypothetical protein